MVRQALGIFSTIVGAVGSFFIILLLTVYLVLNPAVYISHLFQLLPSGRLARFAAMFRLQGKALRLWLLGRLVSIRKPPNPSQLFGNGKFGSTPPLVLAGVGLTSG